MLATEVQSVLTRNTFGQKLGIGKVSVKSVEVSKMTGWGDQMLATGKVV